MAKIPPQFLKNLKKKGAAHAAPAFGGPPPMGAGGPPMMKKGGFKPFGKSDGDADDKKIPGKKNGGTVSVAFGKNSFTTSKPKTSGLKGPKSTPIKSSSTISGL